MMDLINFYSENEFSLQGEDDYRKWIGKVIASEGKVGGELSFIFCDDDYLLEINQKYLNHDTYTDIISFQSGVDNEIAGDIFISTQRVIENAVEYGTTFSDELKRVMIHGVLHFCGYDDHNDGERRKMREKEDEKIEMFHVEQLGK